MKPLCPECGAYMGELEIRGFETGPIVFTLNCLGQKPHHFKINRWGELNQFFKRGPTK